METDTRYETLVPLRSGKGAGKIFVPWLRVLHISHSMSTFGRGLCSTLWIEKVYKHQVYTSGLLLLVSSQDKLREMYNVHT